MDTRKEQQRTELHNTIWKIADDLRGSVDGWDFKAYVLGMLFYRYISENFANYVNKGEWEMQDSNDEVIFSTNAVFDVSFDVSFDINMVN